MSTRSDMDCVVSFDCRCCVWDAARVGTISRNSDEVRMWLNDEEKIMVRVI